MFSVRFRCLLYALTDDDFMAGVAVMADVLAGKDKTDECARCNRGDRAVGRP